MKTQQRKIGIAVVGLGVISSTHIDAIEKSGSAYLAAVCSSSEEKRSRFNCKGYKTVDEAIKDPEVEALALTTPSGSHFEDALKAIRNKKHVLVEKPLEITEERCRILTEEAKENNVVLATVFQGRFLDSTNEIKKAIKNNRFGKIVLADASFKWFRSQAYYDSASWRGTKALDGGGVFMNQGIHSIDLLLYLLDEEPDSVKANIATVAHENIEVEDAGAAVLHFPSGIIGTIEGSTATFPGSRKRVEIRGTKGSAVWEDEFLTLWQFEEEREEDERIREKYSKKLEEPHTGHIRCYRDFTRAITEHAKPLVDGEEAVKSVSLIRRIYEEAQNS